MTNDFITKQAIEMLHINTILDNIEPLSELGKKEMRQQLHYTSGNETLVKVEYSKIERLMGLIEEKPILGKLTSYFQHLNDIEGTIARLKNTDLFELYELFEVKNFLYFYQKILTIINENGLNDLLPEGDLDYLFRFLDPDGQETPSFYISSKFSKRIREYREKISELSTKIKMLKAQEIQNVKDVLQINDVKEEIVISRMNKSVILKLESCGYFYLHSENFANFTYKLKKSDKIIALEHKINNLLSDLEKEEIQVRREITSYLKKYCDLIQNAFYSICKLDYLIMRAKFGHKFNCCIPKISKAKKITLKNIINIPLKHTLEKNLISYQAIDIDFKKKLNIITGSNMAGKTTSLVTVGQICYLASRAIPIPANSATLPLFDFIFFSAASDFSHRMDLSSFGAEVVEISSAMKRKGFGLFLIDEFARGTNPHEGNAFSRAILQSFLDLNAFTIAATHFNSPSKIKQAGHFNVKGLSNMINLENIEKHPLENRLEELHKYLDYSLVEVDSNVEPPKSALIIAEILGVDHQIIELAKKYLD